MFECRDFCPFRVTSLEWLFQLLRIAYEHQTVGGLRYGQDVGELHLPRFVNEKYINRFEEILP